MSFLLIWLWKRCPRWHALFCRMSGFFEVNYNSPVDVRSCVPRWTFRHALSSVDDEGVKVWEVELGAKLGTDATPALEPIRAWRAVSNAASLVVVMHTRGTCHVASRNRAAAQTLRVAALALCCASLSSTLFWALWWQDKERGATTYLYIHIKTDHLF